jgi:hypothetical protein
MAIDLVINTVDFRTQLPHVRADIGHQGGVIFHPAFQVCDPLVQAVHRASPIGPVPAILHRPIQHG